EIVAEPWLLRFELRQLEMLPKSPGVLHVLFLRQRYRRVIPLSCGIDQHGRSASDLVQRMPSHRSRWKNRWVHLRRAITNDQHVAMRLHAEGHRPKQRIEIAWID